MFTNNRDNRVHISEILLSSDNETSVPVKAGKSILTKGEPQAARKFSKGFLVMFLLICTSVVAAFVIKNIRTGNKVLAKHDPVASNKAQQKNTFEREAYIYDLREKIKDHKKTENDQNVKNSILPQSESNHLATAVSNRDTEKPTDAAFTKTQYQVISKAFFYREPNKSTRDKTFISSKESYSPFNSLAEENGFIYGVITDENGETKEGWLRKKDLKQVRSLMYESDLK
jgi:hypothetical protein